MHRTGILTISAMLIVLTIILSSCSFGVSGSAVEPSATPQPTAEPTATPVVYESGAEKVALSEIMSKNKATVTDKDGDFSDWIEIKNTCGEDINLFGWTLTDGSDKWVFPDFTLYSDSVAVIFASGKDRADTELHSSFSLKEGESVTLLDRNGDTVDFCTINEEKSDYSLIRSEEGLWKLCLYPTPGYENTSAGYELFCSSRTAKGPLVINEVCVDNFSDYDTKSIGFPDWVELKNISSEAVELSQFCISDDSSILRQFTLSGSLAPGGTVIVLCDKDAAKYTGTMMMAPFSLNSENDRLFLSTISGEIIDFTPLKGIPYGMTYGRAEGRNGFFYFRERTPDKPNGEAARRISDKPYAPGGDGIFNGVDAVSVELRGAGDIYYTLDCTEPTTDSAKYEHPLSLSETTVVRALCVEPDALESDILTLSFIINENHTLPVASLVCGSAEFRHIYEYGIKDVEIPASVSFYEEDGSFTIGCGVKLNGASSLVLPKKNLSLRFRGSYGAEKLEYDLFDGGVSSFTNLVLRAGQDQNNTIIRNEACYRIAEEFTDSVYTLRFKYCILYIDGKYNGIYAFIEKPNEAYVAEMEKVSKKSVSTPEAAIYSNDPLYREVIGYAYENDLQNEENYAEISKHIDISSLIDWTLLQGFFGNYDLASGNLRYARSTENDGKWRLMLYDLDCAFSGPDFVMYNVFTYGSQISNFNTAMLRSPVYRDALLRRAAVAFQTVLNEQHMIEVIDELCSDISGEVERDKQFSGMSVNTWTAHIDSWKDMITGCGWDSLALENLCRILHVTAEERAEYFGGR